MSNVAKLKAERKWSANKAGLQSLSRRYLFVRDNDPAGVDADEIASVPGLPAIGSRHSLNNNLVVVGYDFEEGDVNGKRLLGVNVKYEADVKNYSAGEGEEGATAIDQWGWTSSSVSRDLAEDAGTGLTVLNSAGDPFDSVPQVDRPVLEFRMSMRTTKRRGGWLGYIGKVNEGEMTIGGLKCPARTVRVVGVDEEHLFADPNDFRYRYTIALQYLSNTVAVNGDTQKTEIGWDVAVVDQGLRERDASGNVRRITDTDDQGNTVETSLPVLLNGEGQRATGTTPYMIRVQAYEETTIPSEFYAEPAY